MPDKIDSQRVIFQGGLNTSENFLYLSNTNPGFAIRLVNYETALSGGYRRINGYEFLTTLAADAEVTSVADPAEGPILGVWGFVNSTNNSFQIIAARKLQSGNTYGFFLFDGVDTWNKINTGTTQSSIGVSLIRYESFATEASNNIAFVDGVNKALLFDSTTWYQLSSSGTGGSGSPGGNQLIDAPALIMYFKNTLIVSGDPNTPSIVVYSAPNDPLTWTAAAGAGQLPMGYYVVQLKAFRDEGYVFGIDRIRKMVPDLAVGFTLQDVTNNIGCIARDSVLEVNSNIVFFAPDGVRTIAGTEKIGDVDIGPFSENIHNTITTIVDNFDLTNLRSLVIRTKTQFRYFINNDVTAKNDAYGLIGCVRHSENSWEFGELSGFEVSASWSGYDEGGEEIILHGDMDGFIYVQERGNSFAGDPITSIYTSPYIDLGDTTVRKLFRRIDLFMRLEGTLTANLGIKYDWDNINAINPAAYILDSSGSNSYYDAGFNYDDNAMYGGTSQPVFKTNIQGSGFSTQVSITSSGIYTPHTLQGYVINFSVKGRE